MVMRSISVNSNTNRMDVQRQLKDFSWFSAVDVSVADHGCVKLTEVDLLERLRRSLVGNKEREKASQDALLKLSEINPAIRLALGTSILDEKSWSASELRSKLKLPAERLVINEITGKFHLPQDHPVGLANIRAEESDANMLLRWKIIPKNGADTQAVSGKINVADKRVNQFVVAAGPEKAELRKIYLDVLQDAINDNCSHVTLSPIPDQIDSDDYDQIFHQAFSDTSIRCLLEAIDSIKLSHPSPPRVTITTDRIPGLADRIKDLDAARKANSTASSLAAKKAAAMPLGLAVMTPSLQNLLRPAAILNLSGVEKISKFDNVKLYWDDPHRLAADTMILQFKGLRDASTKLATGGFTQLERVRQMMFDPERLVGKEVNAVKDRSKSIWGIAALEMPPCEIDTSRLFVMNPAEGESISASNAEQFFLDHLLISKGRVVIDLPESSDARAGLLSAIYKFKDTDSGKYAEIVLATNTKKIYEEFSAQVKQPSVTWTGTGQVDE